MNVSVTETKNTVEVNPTTNTVSVTQPETVVSITALGPTGPAGQNATISLGTHSGLSAGATPTVSNTGTTTAAVFNFGIPAGATGPQGNPGANGSNGADGADGVIQSITIDGSNGITPNNQTYNSATNTITLGVNASDLRSHINVEDGATGDQTNAEIRTAVEAATDSNVFTDADHTKLNGLIDWTASGAGTIHSSNIPAIALTNVQEASSQSAQLALTTQEGDVVVRTDENKSYVRNSGTAGNMNDFTLLRTPTDAVLSVNGNTGAISLTHDGFSDFVANEHIDWTADQGSTNIHSGNYTDTTYSVGDGGLTQNNFTNALKTKLDNAATSDEATALALALG